MRHIGPQGLNLASYRRILWITGGYRMTGQALSQGLKTDAALVLVADTTPDHNSATVVSRDLELASARYFRSLRNGLESLGRRVVHYGHPNQLQDAIRAHRNDLVVSIWSGTHSRNRRALVPAICEAAGIRYVGADVFTQIVSQDKWLSRHMARQAGLRTARGILIQSVEQIHLAESLGFPVVVKPIHEGGSIGISNRSRCESIDEVRELASMLLESMCQPLLIEEFVAGRETCVCILGGPNEFRFFEAVELYPPGKPAGLYDQILGYELKKKAGLTFDYEHVSHLISDEDRRAITRLLQRLNRAELIRVDGRIDDDGFCMLELSPDVHLGPDSDFGRAYEFIGSDYVTFLRDMVSTAEAHYASKGWEPS